MIVNDGAIRMKCLLPSGLLWGFEEREKERGKEREREKLLQATSHPMPSGCVIITSSPQDRQQDQQWIQRLMETQQQVVHQGFSGLNCGGAESSTSTRSNRKRKRPIVFRTLGIEGWL
jgi:hypothetical protein